MNDEAFTETTIEIESAGYRLQGTLTLPTSDVLENTQNNNATKAVVLLLTDNGPLDRNQNTLQAQLNIFNQMAEHLAANSIASLRYDKRGCGLSKGKFDAAGHSDLVLDAKAWLSYLTRAPDLNNLPIHVLGHGEGAVIAAQLCTSHSNIVSQVLLTPFVENYESIIRRQAENALRDIAELEGFKGKLIRFFLRINGDQLAKQRKLIAKILKSRRDTLKIRKQVINAKWIREMVNLDTENIYAQVSTPTLIIGGEKDLQCLPEDTPKIASLLKGPVHHHVLSDLTHILRADPKTPSIQHYLMLSIEDVDARILDQLVQWFNTDKDNLAKCDDNEPLDAI